MTPEESARQAIDGQLAAAGWVVQDKTAINLSAARGVVIRELCLKTGHGEADYLLYVDAKAVGTVEAKPAGWTLHGVEEQTKKYAAGLPKNLPAWRDPLPFRYESTGVETHFTNNLDPQPRARNVFSFHRPETLLEWTVEAASRRFSLEIDGERRDVASTLNARLKQLPPLLTQALWDAQIKAITNLEKSLAENRPRALIQMATGSGKTFTAVNFVYRLVKFAGARRVPFLVDRGTPGGDASIDSLRTTWSKAAMRMTRLTTRAGLATLINMIN